MVAAVVAVVDDLALVVVVLLLLDDVAVVVLDDVAVVVVVLLLLDDVAVVVLDDVAVVVLLLLDNVAETVVEPRLELPELVGDVTSAVDVDVLLLLLLDDVVDVCAVEEIVDETVVDVPAVVDVAALGELVDVRAVEVVAVLVVVDGLIRVVLTGVDELEVDSLLVGLVEDSVLLVELRNLSFRGFGRLVLLVVVVAVLDGLLLVEVVTLSFRGWRGCCCATVEEIVDVAVGGLLVDDDGRAVVADVKGVDEVVDVADVKGVDEVVDDVTVVGAAVDAGPWLTVEVNDDVTAVAVDTSAVVVLMEPDELAAEVVVVGVDVNWKKLIAN